jgi:hypothetical protein
MILWSLADLYSDALKLRKKIKTQRKKLAQLRADFQYCLQTLEDLRFIEKQLWVLYGQKSYLEKLLSPAPNTPSNNSDSAN